MSDLCRYSALDYSFAIPPIEGWETAVGTNIINIEIFGTTVPCTIEKGNNYVRFTGANHKADLDFTLFDDDSFSYTGTILFEKTDGSMIMVESSLEEGEISGDFISGTDGIARAWEVIPSSEDNETGTARLLYLTYEISTEEDVPTFTADIFVQADPDSSLYVAPSELDLDDWVEKRELFDKAFPNPPSSAEVTYTLNNGVWELSQNS